MQVYTFIYKDTKIEILGRTQHILVVIHKYCKLGDMKARKHSLCFLWQTAGSCTTTVDQEPLIQL